MNEPLSEYVNFIWPFMLLTLLFVPLLVWLYVRLRRKQTMAAAALGPLGAPGGPGGAALTRRRNSVSLLFLLGLTALLISLARPQMVVSLPRIQGTVILAFDISNSMLADDLEPTRLEAAQAAARLFVENQPPTIDLGVVAFGIGGLIVQPPTQDRTAVLDALAQLSPEGGTSLGQGIFTSLNAIAGETLTINEEAIDPETGAMDVGQLELDNYSSAVILLLTDGENTGPPDPLAIAQAAAEAGVRLYAIGIGSPAGAVIEVDGFNLVTTLDETLLQQLADLTNGVYYQAQDAASLQEIYNGVDLQLTVEGEMTEITALLAALGLLFFLTGGALSLLWFGRVP